jgi:hypothetical protein|mmetsp:Transcript_76053/g.127855  ORF Transcript_76053/g.127855 Transcript_76053/m.127855 type:complete len:81 (-) Transcript_76053:34-276(-)
MSPALIGEMFHLSLDGLWDIFLSEHLVSFRFFLAAWNWVHCAVQARDLLGGMSQYTVAHRGHRGRPDRPGSKDPKKCRQM